MKPPIFIIGNPRSGTTLFRIMLTSHKDIIIPPECGFAAWFYEKYKNWGQIGFNKELLKDFMKDLMSARKIEFWDINEKEIFKFILKKKPTSYSKLVSYIYIWYAKTHNKVIKRWGDKNNFYLNYIPILKKMFPSAFFIHLVRDGRDVAVSYKNLSKQNFKSNYAPKLPNKIEDIVNDWKNNINTIYQSFKLIKSENNYLLKYEDLVYNPKLELQKLCNKLGEEFDLSMLNYYEITVCISRNIPYCLCRQDLYAGGIVQ